jgi:hypothetical protein
LPLLDDHEKNISFFRFSDFLGKPTQKNEKCHFHQIDTGFGFFSTRRLPVCFLVQTSILEKKLERLGRLAHIWANLKIQGDFDFSKRCNFFKNQNLQNPKTPRKSAYLKEAKSDEFYEFLSFL